MATGLSNASGLAATGTSLILGGRGLVDGAGLAPGGGLGGGVSAPVDPDVGTWISAVVVNGGTVSPARAALVSTMVTAWKTAGIYSLIDDAWLLVAENEPQALTSLKQRRLATAVNAPAFTVDRGYAFAGTSYIDTGFTPSVNAVAMTGTSLHIAVYERTNLASGNVAAGCVNLSTQNLMVVPRNATSIMSVQLNSQANGPAADPVADSRGLTVGSRNGTLSADVLAYRNGVATLPWQPGTVGVTLPTVKIYIGCRSDATNTPVVFRAATEGFVSVGAAIPAVQQPAFYNAIQNFMIGAGAAIAPWSPYDLGASLIAIWDAERLDLITRDDNGRVSSWKDGVGGYELTQANVDAQPIWSPTAFNGRPAITPDGVNDFMELAGSPSFLPAGAAPGEDWYVVDQTSPTTDATLQALGAWGNTANANSRTVFRQVSSGANRTTGNVGSSTINTLADFTGRHIVRLAASATDYIIEIDGLAMAATASVPATIATRIRMFAGATTTPASFSKVITNARVITGPLTTQQTFDLRQWMKGRSPPPDPDVAAWSAAVVTNGGTVSSARFSLVEAMVAGWRASGVWPLIEDAWLLVAENEPQALTSLKQRRLAVATNSPAFTIDQGYAFGGTSYLDTGFTPSVNAVAMTGTNMHIALYERTNFSGIGVAAGSLQASTGNISINPRSNVSNILIRLSSTTGGPDGDVLSDSRGFTVGCRNGLLANDIVAYKNGVPVVPFTATSLGTLLSNRLFYIGCSNNAGTAASFRAATEGFVSVGVAIPAGQQPAFYSNLQTFMTAVGAQVP